MKSRINNLFDGFLYAHYILLSLVLIGFVSLLFYIFLTYPIIFHSDSTAFIALAKERMETFSIFPKDWCYSTGIMLANPSLLIPLFSPIFGYSILARSCSVFLLVILLFFLVTLLFRKDGSKIGYLFALLLLVSGGSSFFAEHMYGQASYLSGICMIMIAILISRKLLEIECALNFKYLANLCVLFVLISFISFSGLSTIVRYVLPFIVSLVIIGFLELIKDFRSGQYNKKDKLNQIVLVCTWLFSLLTGGLCYWMFVSLHETGMGQPINFVGVDSWGHNFGILIDGFKFFSCATFTGTGGYFPFANILNDYRLLIFVFLIFIIPFLLILRFNYIKKRFIKIFILYHIITTLTILSASILTDVYIDVMSSRYFVFPVFLSLIIFGIFINEYFSTRPKKVFFILIIFLPFFFSSSIQMNLPYGKIEIKEGKVEIQKNSNHYSGITEFLKSNKLTYGYAGFWNAGVITALSNWDVQVNPINIHSSGLPIPYYWLSSKRWYDSSYYKGKTFLLVTNRKNTKFDFDFLKIFLGNPCRELKYPGYKVFVYDFNIADKLVGWPSFVQSTKTLPGVLAKVFEDKKTFFFRDWRNFKGLIIEYAKDIDKDKIILVRGWYLEEENPVSKVRYRWMQKRSICLLYLKDLKRDRILKISGITSIKQFSKPIKVMVYLSDRKIDEFLVRRNIFSRMININCDYECNKWQELVIEADQTFIPDKVLHNGDKRELSLMISDISIN
jgi:hypothetical protein